MTKIKAGMIWEDTWSYIYTLFPVTRSISDTRDTVCRSLFLNDNMKALYRINYKYSGISVKPHFIVSGF